VPLEPLRDGRDAVVAFRASGVLTRDDYREVLVPRLEAALAAGGRLRVLVLVDEAFRGWDLRAAWANTCLDLRHRRDFDKVAIVGAPAWERWCARAAGLVIAGRLRTFDRDRLHEAWTWVRG
jgi:hypothetical protein